MATIALDPLYRDWQLVNGRLVIVTGAVEYAQKLAARLAFFRRSWFRDLRQGIPWWEAILVKAPDVPSTTQLLRGVILGTPGTKSISSVVVQYQRAQRLLDYKFEVVHDSGAIVSGGRGAPFLVDGKPVDLASVPEAA